MTTAQIYQSLFASAEHPPKLTIVNESGTYELTQFRGKGPCSIPMLRIETDAQCQATDGQRASIQIEMDAREARELATVLIGFADANEATTEAIERGYLERGREADDLLARHYTPHIEKLRAHLGGGTNSDVLRRAVEAITRTDREREA